MPSTHPALTEAQAHEAGGRIAEATAGYKVVVREGAFEPALTALVRLVPLLMQRLEIAEAQQELAQFLGRQFVLPGSPPGQEPRVLLAYGLESWEEIVFPQFGQALPFVINAGHFDVAALLRTTRLGVDRAFVLGDLDAAAQRERRARLRDYAAVVNVVADPMAEGRSLTAWASLLAEYPGQVINRPALVAATARERIGALWADLPHIVVPRCRRVDSVDTASLTEAFSESAGGIIVRPLNSQTGTGVERVAGLADLSAVAAQFAGKPAYLTDFHEFADANARYIKMRFFRVGDELFPEHRIVADRWNIHSAERHGLMRERADLQDAERRFLADPASVLGADALGALHAALGRFGLDYVGCDLAQTPDGRLLVFEANPAMRVNYDHCEGFPYLRPHLDRIAAAFTRLVERAALGD